MKINYADRKNDDNILSKKFVMLNSQDLGFKGCVGLLSIEKVNKPLVVKRPNGKNEVIIDDGYKILTYFPEQEAYCCSVMFNEKDEVIQWYFDILKSACNLESEIPYGEDMFLDYVVLPDGSYYLLDENDLIDALQNKLISQTEFKNAYLTAKSVEKLIKNDFDNFCKFTIESLKKLQSIV